MKLTYPKITENQEHEIIIAEIMWYTIIPLSFFYMSLKLTPLYLLCIIPTILLRIKK